MRSPEFDARLTIGVSTSPLVPYDYNSLLTGEEVEQGFTFTNSERVFPSEQTRLDAVAGYYKPDLIIKIAPRQFKQSPTPTLVGVEAPPPAITEDEVSEAFSQVLGG